MIGLAQRILRALGGVAARQRPSPTRSQPQRRPLPTSKYSGDFHGVATIIYSPHPDDRPDPGEIVWTWVPFEDDPQEGKDRPVLLVGWDDGWLLGLMLSSKDHHRDAADEARFGRHWMDLGTGEWDSRRRDSEVRLDRIIRVRPDAVRREGAILDRGRFDEVARAVKEIKGW